MAKENIFYTHTQPAVDVAPNQFIHCLRLPISFNLLNRFGKPIRRKAVKCDYHSLHYFSKHFDDYQVLSLHGYRHRANSTT